MTRAKESCSRKSKGFSFVEVLVGLGIISIVAMGTVYVAIFSAKAKKSNTARITAENIRYLFETGIKGSVSWRQTIPLNPEMACLATPDGICDPAMMALATPFKLCLIKTDGTCDVYDPNAAGAGLDMFGKPCTTFDDTNGSDECPFHYDLFWAPICPPLGNCTSPGVQVNAQMSYRPKTEKFPLNAARFSFNSMRPPPPVTLKGVCDAASGTFDPSTNFCLTSALNTGGQNVCPSGTKLTSFNLDGTISCDPIYTGRCPSGQIIGSVNKDGTLNCLPNPCPYPTVECQGVWSDCVAGFITYSVATPAQGAGAECPYDSGTQIACTTPVDCIGEWSACDGGYRTYNISVPDANGGATCPVAHGTIQSCTDCVGAWSACDVPTNTQTYAITTPATNGGAECPQADLTVRSCPMITKSGTLCDLGKLGPVPGVTVQVPCL